MNVIVNFKQTFLQELKKSNIKLGEFCHLKNLNRDLINKVLKKCVWCEKITKEDEKISFHIIENWIIDKQNDSANREIFDVEELISKFKKCANKNVIVNMIMTKTSIDSRKIKALITGSKAFEDLTDDQFHVLKLIKLN